MAQRRLPAAPDRDHLKTQAKRLLAAFRAADADAVADFAAHHPDPPAADAAQLADAQLVLARAYGEPSFPRLLAAAQLRRALRDDDSETLRRLAAHQPEVVRAHGERAFDASRRVTRHNVHTFLRAHAPGLPVDEVDPNRLPQHGDGFVLRDRAGRVVKVPKKGLRQALLKEVRILQHLAGQDLGFAVPEPEFVHADGYYAIYAAQEGTVLHPEVVAALADADQELAVGAMARAFRALHTHRFPVEILDSLPRPKDGYDVWPAQVRRKIQFIREHGGVADADRWEAQLERLIPSLTQRRALAQCDPQLSFFVALGGDLLRLSLGSFYDATLHDPAVDVHDFLLEVRSDIEDPESARRIEALFLEHYESDDPDLAAKVEFGLLAYEVRHAHIAVRAEVRRRERDAV